MYPVSARFLSALSASHILSTRVEAWTSAGWFAVPILDGSVKVTARNRVRRTASLTVAPDLWPDNPTDPLSPYSARLRAFRGIHYPDGTTEEVPVFFGRVVDAEEQDDDTISVEAEDMAAPVVDDEFETPAAAQTGDRVVDEIARLIRETIPNAQVDDTTDASATVPALVWDRDRAGACDQLAESIGGEWFADPDVPDGVPARFRTRPGPTLADPPVWTLADGVNGTVVRAPRSQSRRGVANAVVVTVERPDTNPLHVVVRDNDRTSPTWYWGPFGHAPMHYSNDAIVTVDQAYTAGAAQLARMTGLARSRTVRCVPNPALDVGDVVTIRYRGVDELHLVDEYELPLTAGGDMRLSTRSTLDG